MNHLTEPQAKELREALEAERRAILARGRGHRPAPLPDEDPDAGDQQDQASEEARLRAELTVSSHDRERLAEIDAALGRMEQGTYGICEETGEEIPLPRLRAQPTTRYTVEALELLEDERARDKVRANEAEDDKAY